MKIFNLNDSLEVLQTSECGDKLAPKLDIVFKNNAVKGNVIRVRPEILKQTLQGVGVSFTESSAFVLAHLEPAARAELMANVFSSEGANFSI